MRLLAAALLALLLTACSARIDGVETFSYVGGDERGGLIRYDRLPPPGGPYNPLWQTCGVYPQPIYPEYALHSLARGAVWLTYRPDLAPGDLAGLKRLLQDQPQALLSPLSGQTAAVVVSAWNAQLQLDRAGDGRLRRFIKQYANAATAPEAGKSCAGGYSGTQ